MNFCKIVLKDIKKFLIEQPILFSVLMFSLVVTAFSFCIFIASRMHMANILNTYWNVSNRYAIGSNSEIPKEKINNLEEWFTKKNISNYKINLYSNIEKEDTYNTTENKNETNYNIVIGTNNNISRRTSFIGRIITEKDIEEKSNYAMIDYNDRRATDNPFIVNNTINIRNTDYIVKAIDRIDFNMDIIQYANTEKYIDVLENIESVVIPITTFMDNYKICAIDIIVPDNMQESEKQELANWLNDNFEEHTIFMPERIENVQLSDVEIYIVIFSILIILALINTLALFGYWIDKNWRKYMIYRLCGANRLKIYEIILTESIILCISAIVMGVIIYYLSTPLLKNINVSYTLSIKEISIFQLITVALVALITNIEAVKISTISPRYIGRR